MLNTLDLDYTQELSQLRDDIHLSLEVLSGSSFWNSLKFFNKDVLVYKGDNHIDVVDNGKAIAIAKNVSFSPNEMFVNPIITMDNVAPIVRKP